MTSQNSNEHKPIDKSQWSKPGCLLITSGDLMDVWKIGNDITLYCFKITGQCYCINRRTGITSYLIGYDTHIDTSDYLLKFGYVSHKIAGYVIE